MNSDHATYPFSRKNYLKYSILIIFTLNSLFLLFPYTPFSGQARAADNSVSIESSNAIVNFPEGIDFQMTASDSNGFLVSATITFQFYDGVTRNRVNTIEAPPSTSQYNFSWYKDLNTEQDFLPLGTPFSYYWMVEDNDGNIVTEEKQSSTLTDTRFAWQEIVDGNYIIRWYDRPYELGQAILDNTYISMQRIEDRLGGGLTKPITILVYANREDFSSALGPGSNEWIGGIAYPGLQHLSIVISDIDDQALIRDLPHELSHLTISQVTDPNYAPVWFDEGMAVYNEEKEDLSMKNRFKRAVEKDNLHSLSTLRNNFPDDEEDALLAYAQSWQLISYMFEKYGQAEMHELISTIATTSSFNAALETALQIDLDTLENEWRVSLGLEPLHEIKEPTPTPIPTETQKEPSESTQPDTVSPTLLLVGSALLMIALLGGGGLIIYQRQARQRARRAEYEQMVAALQQQHAASDMSPFPFPQQPATPPGQSFVPPGQRFIPNEHQETPPHYAPIWGQSPQTPIHHHRPQQPQE